MPGLESLDDKDLRLLSEGKIEGLSDAGLQVLIDSEPEPQTVAQPQDQTTGQAASSAMGGFALQPPAPGSSRLTEFANKLAQLAPGAAGAAYGAGAGGAPGAIAGTLLAGPAGTVPGWYIGSAIGAGVGAAGMRSAQLGAAATLEGAEARSPGEVAKDIALTGTGQAAGEAVFGMAGAALRAGVTAIAPYAARFGAQLLRAGPGIPEKYGEAALRGSLEGAPTSAQASRQYAETIASYGRPSEAMREFGEATSPLVSPRDLRAAAGDLVQSPGSALKTVNDAYVKLQAGTLSPQEALNASQAARFLKDQAKFGSPNELANLSNIQQASRAFNEFLEPLIPGFKEARTSIFRSKVREQFTSAFPLNKNLSPNVLRTTTAVAAGAAGLYQDNPYLAVVPLAISPLTAGLGIRLGAKLAQGGMALLKTGTPQAGVRGGIQSLVDAYNARNVSRRKEEEELQE